MSSGGQNGIDLSGITSMRIQNASDVTRQKQFQLSFQEVSQRNGVFNNHFFFNGYRYYRDALNGIKETCVPCVGLPYAGLNLVPAPACSTDADWASALLGSGTLGGPGGSNFTLGTGTSTGSYAAVYKRFESPTVVNATYSWTGSGTNYAWSAVTSLDPSVPSNLLSLATDSGNIFQITAGPIVDQPIVGGTLESCQWIVYGVYTPDGAPPGGNLSIIFA